MFLEIMKIRIIFYTNFLKLKRKGLKPLYIGYEPRSLISLSFLSIVLYFGVWSIKDFDSFGDSLILLNIITLK